MAFDGIVLNCVVSELRSNLVNGKVNKVFQPNKNEITMEIYALGKNNTLLIQAQPEIARFHCTTYSRPNPLQAPNFCMLLRKHLVGARLIAINTFDLERITEFVFESYNELKDKVIKKLFVQVMTSNSNIILTNSENTIIDSIKHVSLPTLEIMPARHYTLPSTTKKSFLNLENFEEFESIISGNKTDSIDKILSDNFIEISRSFVQHLMKDNLNLKDLYNSIKYILENISNTSLVSDEDNYYIYVKKEQKNPLEANFILDNFYFRKENKIEFLQKRNKLLSLISSCLKKYLKRSDNINAKLTECHDMDKYRIYGELLTSNLYKYNSQENLENVVVENYYDNQNKVTIPLDKKYSLSKNIENYFKKYNKLKNTLNIVSLQKEKTEVELQYIQSILFSIENCSNVQELDDIKLEIEESDIFKQNIKSAYSLDKSKKLSLVSSKNSDGLAGLSKPLEYNIEGFTVYVGKNNRQNDFLTLKFANKEDLWFHAQKTQGSHVVLKTENKQIPDSLILKCATLAAQNSKAKNSGTVCVDYCEVKKVKKPSGLRPGMVIYNDYKTIIVNLK